MRELASMEWAASNDAPATFGKASAGSGRLCHVRNLGPHNRQGLPAAVENSVQLFELRAAGRRKGAKSLHPMLTCSIITCRSGRQFHPDKLFWLRNG